MSRKVLPPGSRRESEQKWEAYYTSEAKLRFRERERLLSAMFPEFDQG